MQIECGILCDDVRKEDNGKLIFIGVYPSNIVVPSLPADLRLCLIVSILPTKTQREKFHLTVSLGETVLTKGTNDVDIINTDKSFLIFTGVPVPLTQSGLLKFAVNHGTQSKVVWSGEVKAPI